MSSTGVRTHGHTTSGEPEPAHDMAEVPPSTRAVNRHSAMVRTTCRDGCGVRRHGPGWLVIAALALLAAMPGCSRVAAKELVVVEGVPVLAVRELREVCLSVGRNREFGASCMQGSAEDHVSRSRRHPVWPPRGSWQAEFPRR